MTRSKSLCILLIACSCSLGAGFFAGPQDEEAKSKKVVRAKRPTFKKKDWDGIWFENIFKDGLVGNRPKDFGSKSAKTNQQSQEGTSNSTTGAVVGAEKWSQIIDSSVIEDEIKRIQIALNTQVTTPTRYASGYKKSRESFSMLSMLFQIIREYDSDVRWKKQSAFAQAAFSRAAATSRVGSQQAYQNAKRRKEDLTELVRGGSFPEDEKPDPEADWSGVIDHVQVMIQLQEAIDKLKPMTASSNEMKANVEEVFHQANLVAAMGKALIQEGMENYDEESYVEPSEEMTKAALEVIAATKTNDYDLASKAVNLIEQSCSNCHDEWR